MQGALAECGGGAPLPKTECGGARDIVVLWKANSVMQGGMGTGGCTPFRTTVLETVGVTTLLNAFVAASSFLTV